MKYRVADIVFSMEPDEWTKKQAERYVYDGNEKAECHIIPRDMNRFILEKCAFDFDAYQYLSCGFNFAKELIKRDGTYLHASAVVVDGKAYLFSAPCGTGKSTHTSKWLELFGDKAFIINDDKPAIRIIDGEFFVYGTPWSGKHDISVNTRAKLQGICFLNRAETNWIKPMEDLSAFTRLYHGGWATISEDLIPKYLDVINEILAHIPIWEMGCTPTVEAAKMAYAAMSSKEIK